ncbi:MAG: alpha/beta hydrolase [Pseudomonadota bacterium]
MQNTDKVSQPRLAEARALGETLAYAEWHPELRGDGPTLLFVHATGFHARVWDGLVRRLPPRHTICIDMHGHGRSSGEPVSDWRVFCNELAAFIEALDLSDIVAVGHSMGAHASIGAAAAKPDRFRRLILIDPVVFAPQRYEEFAARMADEPLHPASKRRADFDSVEAMVERFCNRSPYDLFVSEMLEDYCRYGLVAKPEGGLTLACSPEMEASVYSGNLSNIDIFEDIKTIELPVLILRAQVNEDPQFVSFSYSPTWPGLVDCFSRAREIYRPDLSHFMPMQAPDEIASIINDEIIQP